MSRIPIIFCAPGFQNALEAIFPGTQIIPFAGECEACSTQISAMDNLFEEPVWMLYQPNDHIKNNRVVKDHINLSSQNPLIGPVDLGRGPRFPDMSSVYEDQQKDGMVVTFGDDEDLESFDEPWISVESGVWEAIALKHRGCKIQAWIIEDLEKWINDTRLLN